MTEVRTTVRRGGVLLTLVAGLFAVASVLIAGAASAQTVDCPAGARGGAAGNGGTSTGGTGSLALNVPVFSSGTGGANAAGGGGGSARGGTGGRGGAGTLPICNQNTNGGAVAAAPAAAPAAVAAAPAAAPRTVAAAPARTYGTGGPTGASRGYGVGGPVGLARTGSHTSTELGLAGVAFVLGGALLLFGQPLRRARARA